LIIIWFTINFEPKGARNADGRIGSMKKIKVTKRPAARGEITLQPSRVRMFLVYIVLFALAIAAGQVIRWVLYREDITQPWMGGNWMVAGGIVLGAAALMALLERNRWTLRVIGRERVEGPT